MSTARSKDDDERIAREMAALPLRERDRLIARGTLAGAVIDGRSRFERPISVNLVGPLRCA